MHFVRSTLIVLSILSVTLTGCGSVAATSTPVDANAMSTSLVGTMAANLFETQTALAPVPTDTAAAASAPLPTFSSLPTLSTPTPTTYYYYATATPTISPTPTVTGTVYTPTVNPSTLAYGCNNLAFVRDVTTPPGTVMAPGQDFNKTWKVANIGTCDWMYTYALELVSGPAMNGKTMRLGRVVTAGHWAEFSLGLGAPKDNGTYNSYWRLSDGDGHFFGAMLLVSIVVSKSPTSTPTPATTQTATPTPTTAAAAPTNTPTMAPTPTDTPTPEPTATATATS